VSQLKWPQCTLHSDCWRCWCMRHFVRCYSHIVAYYCDEDC